MKCGLFWLVLQFDGSLRRPRDFGFPFTKDLRQVAAGAAAVLSNENTGHPVLLALGGKRVDVSSSASAEYDGLLLGLHWLNQQNDEWWDSNVSPADPREILIEGDCRTVIDQLNGASAPRKLRYQFEQARELLDQLSDRFDLKIRSRRMSREENFLCDAVCSGVSESAQIEAFLDFEAAVVESTRTPTTEAREKTRQKSSALADSILNHMRIDESLLRHSIRPHLYRRVATTAINLGDGLAMKVVGEMLEQTEALLWPSVKETQDTNSTLPLKEQKELLVVEGIKLQIRGLMILGMAKQASQLERKKHHLLGKYGDIQKAEEPPQSLTNLLLSPYRNHVRKLSPGGHEPLLWSWHSAAMQAILKDEERISKGSFQVWVEKE